MVYSREAFYKLKKNLWSGFAAGATCSIGLSLGVVSSHEVQQFPVLLQLSTELFAMAFTSPLYMGPLAMIGLDRRGTAGLVVSTDQKGSDFSTAHSQSKESLLGLPNNCASLLSQREEIIPVKYHAL